ncbi:MAG: LysM peptidoglycan-binding domain-containing protein [Terracoccus sp.]
MTESAPESEEILMSATALQPSTHALPSLRPQLVLVPTGREAVAAARAARPTLRATRRGRLATSVLVAIAVVLLALAASGTFASASVSPRTLVVESGQTLSQIAATQLPDLPVSEGVIALQLANGLSTAHIHAGQSLVVPTS